MKKTLITGGVFGLLSLGVHAQSSVTLYGLLDVGMVFVNNSVSNGQGHQLYSLISGNIQASRWGLRGSEDLGGGMKAIFVLENGFSVVNGKLGQGGDEFGRQAYVGLSTTRFGAITLGRQYDSVVDFTNVLTAATQWATIYFAHPGDLDNMLNSNRVNNAVKYTSISYGGFKFGGLYSLGGVAGQFNRNQIWSVGAGYNVGPLQLGAGYFNVKDPNFSFFGNNATSSATGSNMSGSPVYSGYASAKTQEVFAAGAAYTIGSAAVGMTYSNTQFKDIGAIAGLPANGAGGAAKFNNVEVNFRYQVTPALLVGAGYDYTKGYGVNHAKYHQAGLGADYFLSKRTDVYITGVYQHASGIDSTNKPAVASITTLSPSSTSNQIVAVVGIRHKF
ncbi:Outer membrane protein (porin) [Paraburkholderia steynii]|uniref:Outer membrane protein (Porin) n=1 Tax=Paraburkholderia steynii TaxID=1245441 RepID=A0A7Z7B4E7_9BURK|nr:porin [Paraburkholderia steynii]SDH24504.1 Outer membrane protein (porin) [Paraburkholderia steynii]